MLTVKQMPGHRAETGSVPPTKPTNTSNGFHGGM
jgi:hypothetical protein